MVDRSLGRVAPFTGAWIEIWRCHSRKQRSRVAPFTGAWIEIIAERLLITY